MNHPLKIFIVAALFCLSSEPGFSMDGIGEQLMGGAQRLMGGLKRWVSQGDVREDPVDLRTQIGNGGTVILSRRSPANGHPQAPQNLPPRQTPPPSSPISRAASSDGIVDTSPYFQVTRRGSQASPQLPSSPQNSEPAASYCPSSSQPPARQISQADLFTHMPSSSRKPLPPASDPLNLWTFDPAQDSFFILDWIPNQSPYIKANLAAVHEWMGLLTSEDPTAREEFLNLCHDISAIKKAIGNKKPKSSREQKEPPILLNHDRTYAFLYAIFAYQYSVWKGENSTPLTKSYKSLVEYVWRIITQTTPLSSKESLLNYLKFLAELKGKDIHTVFASLEQRPLDPSPFIKSPPTNPLSLDSFTKAHQTLRSLKTDLTIVRRCFPEELDLFAEHLQRCERDFFLPLFNSEKIQNAVFRNLLYFLSNPTSVGNVKYTRLFEDTYLYLYSIVVFETFSLKIPLDNIMWETRYSILQKLYIFYGGYEPHNPPDFYTAICEFQKKIFPSQTIHEKFQEIFTPLQLKREQEAQAQKKQRAAQEEEEDLRQQRLAAALVLFRKNTEEMQRQKKPLGKQALS